MEYNSKGEHANNFFKVSHEVTENPKFLKLSIGAKLLYHTFCKLRNRYADEQGIFYRSNSDLAKDMNVTVPSVIRMKRELLENDLLRWKQGDNAHACQYQVDHMPS